MALFVHHLGPISPQLSLDGAHRVLLAVARWSRSELNNY